MRSDTPCCAQYSPGRSMLSHVLHATLLAPQRSTWCWEYDHQRIAPLVGELADTLGRRIDVAPQGSTARPGGTLRAVCAA